MQTTTYHSQRRAQRDRDLLEKALLSLAAGAVGFLLFSLLALGSFELLHLTRIYPGVSVAGVPVGGLTETAAARRLSERLVFLQSGQVTLRDGERTWVYTPAQLGLFLDPEASARAAFTVGRQGNLFQRLTTQFAAWRDGRGLPPALVWDERRAFEALTQLAAETDVAVVEPTLKINGTEVVVLPGQTGRALDLPASLGLLSAQLHSLQNGSVPLVVEEIRPVIADIEGQADLARRVLSQPLSLVMPPNQGDQQGPWTFDPTTLAGLLGFERVHDGDEARYQLTLNSQALGSYLAELGPRLARYPQNPHFTFNDSTGQLELLQPGVIGRALDVEASLASIREKVMQGEHNVELAFTFTPPPVSDQSTGEDLGVRELVISQFSYFYGSGPERVQNIQAAAARFHGLLVPPGATFSMAEALGDISLENGYAEALIISGGRTIQGVGGGVCQVSTTLFRTVFFGGYPVVERHPHAYRVSYYEKEEGNRRNPRLAGLDAAVFVPLVDFKFINNSSSWLLMETYVNPTYSNIQWKFYSTNDGRSVDWETTGPTNVKEAPKPSYKENPDLPTGEVKQVDYAADGAEIRVIRRAYKDGALFFEDSFYTEYQPWQAMYEYGPGTEGMPPEDTEEPAEE